MSDDELKNGRSTGGDVGNDGAGDEAMRPQADAPSGDDIADSYDVAGAALGALDRDEDAGLRVAASVDTAVSAELAAMEAVAAELARLAPTQPMNRGRSAGIRSRLVARAAATRVGRTEPVTGASEMDQSSTRQTKAASARERSPVRRPSAPVSSVGGSPSRQTPIHVIPFEPRSRPEMGRVMGVFALAAVLVIAAFGIHTWRGRSTAGTAATSLAAHDSRLETQVAELHASVARKDSLIGALTGMNTRVIDLVSYSTADPMGRVFWDQKTHMFIMYASNLKRPSSGKTYQMWLIARGGAAPVSAGTFMPDSNGSAIMATKHPMAPGTLRRVAVTEEPDGGAAAPTGPVLFIGAIR